MAYITFQPSAYFNTKLYTGDGEPAGNAITGVGFQPDWVWIKERSSSNNHLLFDAVRGVTKSISSNLSSAEVTDAQYLTTFGTDGFTVGPSNDINEPPSTYASWNWKAGGGAGSSNTDGSINTTSTSVNTTSGFSIVKYTGTGSNASIGHGLGVKPAMIMIKNLETNGEDWAIYHKSLGGYQYYLKLNSTSTVSNNTNRFYAEPTTSVVNIGSVNETNQSGVGFIAYCFAEKQGYSKFGQYEGNGNTDGSFVYTGFKPAFVMMKGIDSGGSDNWNTCDNKRVGYNAANWRLYPNATAGENTTSLVDLLSNGFKLKVSSTDVNADAKTYIFMAFAEHPFVASNGDPATAR